MDFRQGEVLAGKYRVERVLGAGGMGVVIAAHHLQLDTRVAIKVLRPSMLEDKDATARFAREARAAAKITNEYVARVLDVGNLESGAPYIVMEFLEGEDLAAWLQKRGPLPIDRAVDFVLQACIAVAEAHKAGIIHRDLKPSNLFCTRRTDGQFVIKVLDFGISKRVDPEAGMSVTRTNTVMGSPLYMSPEQLRSTRDVDHRTDIWALGIIAFELLAARVPFDGETFTEVAVKASTEPPVSLRRLRPEVPPGLEAVIEKCLAKAPAGRYRTVAELASALVDFGSRQARALAERVVAIAMPNQAADAHDEFGATAGNLPSALASSWSPRPRVSRSRRGPVVALLGASLAGALIVGGAWVRAARSAHAPATTALPPIAAEEIPPAIPAATTPAEPPAPSAVPALAPVDSFVPLSPSAAPPAHVPRAKATAPLPRAPRGTTPPAAATETGPSPRPPAAEAPAVDPLSKLKVK